MHAIYTDIECIYYMYMYLYMNLCFSCHLGSDVIVVQSSDLRQIIFTY